MCKSTSADRDCILLCQWRDGEPRWLRGSILGDFPTIKAHFLVQNSMIWSLFQCKAQSGIVRLHTSGLLFITNRAACLFFISWHQPDGGPVLWLNSPGRSHLFCFLPMWIYFPGVRRPREWKRKKRNATRAIKKLHTPSLCLQLTTCHFKSD